ncbi:MAG: hypothetical protein AAF556_08875, partial [Pseudomonadota bacterium]
MTPHEQLRDAQISHAVGLRRLDAGILRRIIGLLDATEDDLAVQIRQRLASIDGPFPLSQAETERLREMLSRLRGIRDDAYAVVNDTLRDEMIDLAQYEVEFQQRLTADNLGIDLTAPSVGTLRAAVTRRPFQGRLLRDWARGLRDIDRQRIADEINIGLVEGEGIERIVRRIRGTRRRRYRDGVLEISRRNAAAVVRTAVSHTQ